MPVARSAIALAASAAVAFAAAAQPVPMYEIRDLGTLAGPSGTSAAMGVNEHGVAVGISSAPATSTLTAGLRPFIWGPVPGSPVPVMRDLLPGIAGMGPASDVNDFGVAVGTLRRANTGTTQGFVVGGPLTVVPPVAWIEPLQGGNTTTASDINNSNIAVGSSNIAFGPLPPSATHAIRWHNGQTQGLGTLGGRNSEARGINNPGSIVGVSDVAPSPTSNHPIRRGFVLPHGGNQMQALPALSPHGSSWANDICDFNLIVGGADQMVAISPLHATRAMRAVLWTPNSTSIINLGVLRNTDRSSESLAVASNGDVVGWSGTVSSTAPSTGPTPLPGGQGTRAFIWREHHMTDLNTRIPANSGWILHAATGVNDEGQIVGWGTRVLNTTPTAAPRIHAFILTPLPLDAADEDR